MSLAALAAAAVLSLALGTAPGRLAALMRPATAVRVLVLAALTAALTTGFALSVLALVALARAGEVAEIGHWSPAALPAPGPLPWVAGVPVALAVGLLLAGAAVHTVRVGHQMWLAETWCRSLGPDDGTPVVIDDAEPQAFAVAGLRGRIVVSTAMVAALTAEQRAALVAHERSHLRHRHHVWIQLAEVSAVANPLLRKVPGAVRSAAERWADEDAAAAVGSRRVTAQAIGHAALARAGRSPSPALAATGGDVPQRVRALLDVPRHRWSRPAAAALTVVAVSAAVLSGATAHATERLFETAQTAGGAATGR
jgi:Zn-dependent protease with chaperone function